MLHLGPRLHHLRPEPARQPQQRAAALLKMVNVPCTILKMDDRDARLWELEENLHRHELTVQERADHIAEWMRLTAEKGAQHAPPGGKQLHDKGIKAAVRELGIDRTEAQRAVKIASITPEARKAADEACLPTQKARLTRGDQLENAVEPHRRTIRFIERATRREPAGCDGEAHRPEQRPVGGIERTVDKDRAPVRQATFGRQGRGHVCRRRRRRHDPKSQRMSAGG